MKNATLVFLVLLVLMLTGCLLGGNQYIGHYKVQYEPNSEFAARQEMRVLAERVANELGFSFDEIIDDGNELIMLVKETNSKRGIANHGLVFSFIQTSENRYNITISKQGKEEDESVKILKKHIEAALIQARVHWTYRVMSSSYAKP